MISLFFPMFKFLLSVQILKILVLHRLILLVLKATASTQRNVISHSQQCLCSHIGKVFCRLVSFNLIS